ncbi:MAG TPA: GNAT family N-acetyltransferase [Chitinophagaceae bacterium]|jgi:ribosomal protein S18 acetylase RimI-like enzyme|nr:GNAT family N-acetyltransferase [Chitinophagaceae bacterium]
MDHILDNMIWNAITTGNNDIAIINGDVGCYLPDIAPFAGMKIFNDANLKKLYEFIPANRSVAISSLHKMDFDESRWKLLQPMDVTQMVYEHPVNTFTTKNSPLIVPLSDEHVPQMMELTALTRPGPFLQQTIRFKNYFGIFIEGRLAAMSGQRMHPLPYLEVSAVCTHPDFRGLGYAKALMLHVMKIILDNSFIPFLHVLSNNSNAIELYKTIGFRTRKQIFVDVIRRL